MKNKIIVIIGIVILILFSGCMSLSENNYGSNTDDSIKIYFKDDIDNPSYMISKVIVLDKKSYKEYEELDIIYVVRQKPVDNLQSFVFIQIDFRGEDWRFMDFGLKIKIDDELITYTKEEVIKDSDVISGSGVRETLTWVITDKDKRIDQLKKINQCEELILQYWVDPMRLTQGQIDELKDFLNEYYGLSYDEVKSKLTSSSM
jgi:hypothetical protein